MPKSSRKSRSRSRSRSKKKGPVPTKIKITNIKSMPKIGPFLVTQKLVAGDKSWKPIPGMENGIYNAYKVNDNLMIMHDDFGPVTRYLVDEWTWKDTKLSISSKTGTFGFFDSGIIKDVNEEIFSRSSAKSRKKLMANALPRPNLRKDKKPMIANTNQIPGVKLPEEYQDIQYGVIAGTGTGKGAFRVYKIDKYRAILIGGKTMTKAMEEEGMRLPTYLKKASRRRTSKGKKGRSSKKRSYKGSRKIKKKRSRSYKGMGKKSKRGSRTIRGIMKEIKGSRKKSRKRSKSRKGSKRRRSRR